MRRRSFVAAPSRGARRDLSQAGLRRVKRASGAAAYRPSGSAAQTAFSYPVRGARTARVVCRGDGEWARREGRLRGMAARLRAAAGGRPSPAANAESVGGKSGRRAQKQRRLCRRKSPIVGAQSAFLSSRRSAEGFCRPSGKGGNASIVFPPVRKTFPPFPAGERGGTSRLYEASGCRVRRFFAWLPLGGRPKGGRGFLTVRKFCKNGSALRRDLLP